jgi:hypothetical protein
MRSASSSFRFVFAILVMAVGTTAALSVELPTWPLDYVVLKSELIVQGRVVDDHFILVDKVFLGTAAPSGRIYFTSHIELTRIAEDDCDRTTMKSYRGMPCRTVDGKSGVFFLHKDKPTDPWQTTGWGSGVKWLDGEKVLGYYQLDNPGPYVLGPNWSRTPQALYHEIDAALEKRLRYFAALNNQDPQKKIELLMPFLDDNRSWLYWLDAVHSLAAIGPAGGKTLREMAKAPSDFRLSILEAIGNSGDPESVPFLTQLVEHGKPMLRDFRWATATPDQRRTINEWQVGLCALSKINSPNAVSVLRDSLSDWEQVEESYMWRASDCIHNGLNRNPDIENLRAFQKVYRLYPRWYGWQGSDRWASWLAMGFLEKHRFKEAIPLLVEQLDHPDAATSDEAVRILREIVGTDLGKSKDAWLEWYARNQIHK